MADYQKSFTVLAEELISPPFAFLWKVFESPPANLAGLSLLLVLRLGKEDKHWHMGIWVGTSGCRSAGFGFLLQ